MSISSPFLHRFGTNCIAHPEEEDELRRGLEAQRTIICQLDHELLEIEAAVLALDLRRKEVQLRRDEHMKLARNHQTLLLSILHLPDDVLLRIFTVLVTSTGWAVGQRNSPHPIVDVSHVCTHWRALSLSTPTLWTTLSLCNFPLKDGTTAGLEDFGRRMRLITDMFSALISRVGACPVDLVLSVCDPPFNPQAFTRVVGPFVGLLCQVQWASIDLTIHIHNTPSPLTKLLQVPRHSEETLRRAQLHFKPGRMLSSQSLEDGLDIFKAKSLTSLEVFTPGLAIINAKVNWGKLLELTLGGALNIDDASTIFTRCPNLVRCTIELEADRVSPWGTEASGPPRPATLRHLRSLALSGYQPPERFAEALTLPSLQALSILDAPSIYPETRQGLDVALPAWTRIYGGQLTQITFSFGRLTLQTVISCLWDLPNLVSLELQPPILPRAYPNDDRLSSLHRSILLALTAKTSAGERLDQVSLLPRLRRLSIHRPDGQIKAQDFVDLVSSRRHQGSTAVAYLDSFDVHFLDLDSNSAALAEESTIRVQAGLAEKGVSSDGICFRVEPTKRREPIEPF